MSDDIGITLLASAREALKYAYAPYSEFKVGAAVLTKDGRIYLGANIENASYGLAVCAERTAIFHALVNGARQIKSLAVTTQAIPKSPGNGMPCGACRQVMAEFMEPTGKVIIDNVGIFSLAELLPEPFKL